MTLLYILPTKTNFDHKVYNYEVEIGDELKI